MQKRRGERGLGSKSQALLELVIHVLTERQPCTVRGVAYPVFNLYKGITSMAKGEVQKVGRRLVQAREQQRISWKWIVDESRRVEVPPTWEDLGDFAEVLEIYRKNFWQSQKYCVQVWSEKSTVGGVIRPITDKYGVPFLSLHGFASATVTHDLAEASRADTRTWIVLYVGDHDPSGMYMSEVDLPARFAKYNGRVTVHRIALVDSDLPGLPSFPATKATQNKKDDPRYDWYRSRYGTEAWELDALDPRVLRARVEEAIRLYIDPDEWRRMEIAEAAEQKTVKQFAKKLTAIFNCT